MSLVFSLSGITETEHLKTLLWKTRKQKKPGMSLMGHRSELNEWRGCIELLNVAGSGFLCSTLRNLSSEKTWSGRWFMLVACWQVRWRPVFWGVGIQLLMGLIVLRWKPGYSAFYWLASKVQALLNYADYGAKFMFGDPEYLMHPMAFKVNEIYWRKWEVLGVKDSRMK